jgi:hypothetical protein
MMESDALRLAKAQHVISAMQAERARLQYELKQARLENTRLHRAVVALQRQAHTREKEVARG